MSAHTPNTSQWSARTKIVAACLFKVGGGGGGGGILVTQKANFHLYIYYEYQSSFVFVTSSQLLALSAKRPAILLASSAECLVVVSQHCRIQARRCKAWRGDWPDERSWTPRRGGPSAGSASGSSGGSRPPACSGPCWGGPACRTGRKHTAQHELTAYLTVPNHGMNSQPT